MCAQEESPEIAELKQFLAGCNLRQYASKFESRGIWVDDLLKLDWGGLQTLALKVEMNPMEIRRLKQAITFILIYFVDRISFSFVQFKAFIVFVMHLVRVF